MESWLRRPRRSRVDVPGVAELAHHAVRGTLREPLPDGVAPNRRIGDLLDLLAEDLLAEQTPAT